MNPAAVSVVPSTANALVDPNRVDNDEQILAAKEKKAAADRIKYHTDLVFQKEKRKKQKRRREEARTAMDPLKLQEKMEKDKLRKRERRSEKRCGPNGTTLLQDGLCSWKYTKETSTVHATIRTQLLDMNPHLQLLMEMMEMDNIVLIMEGVLSTAAIKRLLEMSIDSMEDDDRVHPKIRRFDRCSFQNGKSADYQDLHFQERSEKLNITMADFHRYISMLSNKQHIAVRVYCVISFHSLLSTNV